MMLASLLKTPLTKCLLWLIFCIAVSFLITELHTYWALGKVRWMNSTDLLTFYICLSATIAMVIAVAKFKDRYIFAAKEKKICDVIKYTFYTVLTAHLVAAAIVVVLFFKSQDSESFLFVLWAYIYFSFFFSLGLMLIWGLIPYSLISFIIYKFINRRKKEKLDD